MPMKQGERGSHSLTTRVIARNKLPALLASAGLTAREKRVDLDQSWRISMRCEQEKRKPPGQDYSVITASEAFGTKVAVVGYDSRQPTLGGGVLGDTQNSTSRVA